MVAAGSVTVRSAQAVLVRLGPEWRSGFRYGGQGWARYAQLRSGGLRRSWLVASGFGDARLGGLGWVRHGQFGIGLAV